MNIIQLRRAHIAGRDTCTGQCETPGGCDCTPDTVPVQPHAAEASSELLEDDAATERRFRLGAWFWSAYLAIVLVATCAAIAHFLPALSALVSN